MRIVTRRRLPGPIGRGGSESGGIHDFRVIEAGNQNAKNVFSMVRKNFYTIGSDFFFFLFFPRLRLLYLEIRVQLQATC